MNEIKFKRDVAVKIQYINTAVNSAILIIILFSAVYGFIYIQSSIFKYNPPTAEEYANIFNFWFYNGTIIIVLYNLVSLILSIRKWKTMIQSYSNERLRKEWRYITHSIDTAKLQIVNSIDIDQGIIDKLFGVYNVEITYGFSSEGYTYNFRYLSLDMAEEIQDKIKIRAMSVDLK